MTEQERLDVDVARQQLRKLAALREEQKALRRLADVRRELGDAQEALQAAEDAAAECRVAGHSMRRRTA